MYTAYATVNNGESEWEVTIYSHFETITEAEDEIRRFKKNYEGTFVKVVSTRIV